MNTLPRYSRLISGSTLVLLAATASAEPGRAALEWDGDSIYFFQPQGTYLHYKLGAGKIIEEKPIAGNWSCIRGPVDAAVSWSRKAYLFSGATYVRYNMDTNTCDAGYPKPIAGNWSGLPWDRDLDAVVSYNGKAYFFKGGSYVRFDIAADRADAGYPKTIKFGWKGVWENDLDSAVNNGRGKVLFFKGSEYITFDIAHEAADGGPRPSSEFFGAPPAAPPPAATTTTAAGACVTRGGSPPPTDKIVFNGKFYDPPALKKPLMNFHASACGGSWPASKTYTIYNELTKGAHVDVKQVDDPAKKLVAPPTNVIVLHETGSPQGYANANLVHFLVESDGKVYQLMDLGKWSPHTHNTALAKVAIGIEVSNGLGGTDQRNYVSDPRDPQCKVAGRCINFGGLSMWYLRPSEAQLEALATLVEWLLKTRRTEGGHTIDVPKRWPTTELFPTAGARYDLFGLDVAGAGWYHVRETYCDKTGQSFLEKRLCQGGGVISHSVVNGSGRRLDGGALVLATWLAIKHQIPGYEELACIIGRPNPSVGAARSLAAYFTPGGRYKLAQVFLSPLDTTCLPASVIGGPTTEQ